VEARAVLHDGKAESGAAVGAALLQPVEAFENPFAFGGGDA
jgi:hypothetical protein